MTRLPRLFRRPQRTPKPPFTDAQIVERAHTLWQARQASGKAGTETDDWEAAKASLVVEQSLPQRLRSLWSPVPTAEAQKTALELRKLNLEEWKVWIAGLGLVATVTAGVGLYLNYQQGQEKLVTERFAKSVEQLGSKEIDVRIGAIYSLERIAKDSPKDHWTIMEVLTAFVRNRSQFPPGFPLPTEAKKGLPIVTTDVQAALTVIGRRDVEHISGGQWLDLTSTNLNNASLVETDFSYADLSITNLKGVRGWSAEFSGTRLMGANLANSSLQSANLTDAKLWAANLNNADLREADLTNADLTVADLNRANLKSTRGITPEQIKAARNWQAAQYDPDFRKQLGLPPEKPKP